MTTAALLESLLTVGRSEQFGDVGRLSGAGHHATMLRLSDHHAETLVAFVTALNNKDRAAFVKAVAAYEHTVGGVGSLTTLHRLLPLVEDPDRSVLGWIVSNTRSYWYYSHDATSLAELDTIKAARSERTDSNLKRENEREAEAKCRKAASATKKLFNAIRRDDIKAVRALLALGGDPTAKAPDGSSLHDYAVAAGRVEIASELARASAAT